MALMSRCPFCSSAGYCSDKCRKEAWQVHHWAECRVDIRSWRKACHVYQFFFKYFPAFLFVNSWTGTRNWHCGYCYQLLEKKSKVMPPVAYKIEFDKVEKPAPCTVALGTVNHLASSMLQEINYVALHLCRADWILTGVN